MFVPRSGWRAESSLPSETNKSNSLRHDSSEVGFQEPQQDRVLAREEIVKEEQRQVELQCFGKTGGICSGIFKWDGQWHLSSLSKQEYLGDMRTITPAKSTFPDICLQNRKD